MSLHIYTNLDEVKNAGKKFRLTNDIYFDANIQLKNTDIESFILDFVDNAKYVNKDYVSGKFSEYYEIDKLSTGCKTLLNILHSPDKCFSVTECGNNALEALFSIRDGNVLWEFPMLAFDLDDESCDVEFRGKNYTNVFDFLDEVERLYYEGDL